MAQSSAYNSVFASHGSSLELDARPYNLHQVNYLHINSSSSDNKKKRCTSIREEEEEEEEEEGEGEEESCCSEDAMAMEQHQHQQRDRKQAIEGFASHGVMRTGLMRYHSAPSSILASLLGLEDDFLQQEAEFARLFPEDIADFESKMASHFDMDKARRPDSNGRGQEPGCSGSQDFESNMDSHFDIDKGRPCSNGRSKQGPALPPIAAAAAPAEISHCIRFTSPHPRLQRAPLVNQSYTPNPMDLKVSDENPGLNPDPMPSCHGGKRLSRMAMDAQEDKPSLDSGLIPGSHGEHLPQIVVNVQGENFDPNHSPNSNPHFNAMPGSYGEPLSQMNMEVKGENLNLCFSAPVHPPDCCLVDSATAPRAAPYTFPMTNTSVSGNLLSENGDTVALNENRGGISPSSKNGLLRHSSSHAGLLLQLNDEKLMLQSSSGNSSEEGSFERRVGPPIHGSYAQWDERVTAVPLNGAIFAARKRIRELEDKFITNPSIQQRDAIEHDALLANQFSLYSCENPLYSCENPYITDKMSPDPVPCRTRAKRGCATHPRSIAERVRRTKISERMKRLQELVPNMEKQTNMTAMLDEAVEYVKHLQQRVRELTEEQSKCHCTCKEQESISSH